MSYYIDRIELFCQGMFEVACGDTIVFEGNGVMGLWNICVFMLGFVVGCIESNLPLSWTNLSGRSDHFPPLFSSINLQCSFCFCK